ncbi:MAG: DUF1116 domain-containing protein [Rhodospirillales bacterium]|nr:DUF1116 domain-containing protein [Rhodospirillales bacterium]
MSQLFDQEISVLNVGLASFADAINDAGGIAVNVDWRPPAEGDEATAKALARLINNETVEVANDAAYAKYLSAQPVLQGLGRAGEAIIGMGERMVLHSGPPIEWARMCGPMQGAIIGAILYEGWAASEKEALNLVASGEVDLSPCHHLGAVGPMSGIISPSMPVWIVKNTEGGNIAYSNLNEGLGKVLRFGANSAGVIEHLKWMENVLAPVLEAAIQNLGGIEIKPLMAQALHMGDEVHNRNAAATSLLIKKLVPAMLRSGLDRADVATAIEFMAGNDHFFLNISMAACKSMLDAAHGVPASTMITAMARNGVEFGIRMSGGGDRWFTTIAPVVDGLYFPGYSMDDAAPDLGDSAITETAGLGGFAMAASPAIVQFVGGTPSDAIRRSQEMALITLGRNNALTLPALNFAGTPAGIDARKVADQNITPIINTGIAHKEPGIGQIGAGITHAPMQCFTGALIWLAGELEPEGS